MANTILNFSLIFCVGYIYCNDDLLSKFHQNGYRVKDFRVELISYNKSSLNFAQVKPFKYNRTTTAHNFTFNLKFDVKDKVEVLVQSYKFLSNEYRHFPVRFQVNLKRAIDANVAGLADLSKCGNITSSYFYKDITYHACNFLLKETNLPPLIPNGKYKEELTFLYLNQILGVIYSYNEVYTPIVYS